MNKLKLVWIVLVMILTMGACGQTPDEATQSQVEDSGDMRVILTKELSKMEQIIDIRNENKYIGWENDEGHSGHIVGAMDFPVNWFEYEKSQEYIDMELERRGLDKSVSTVIYSDSDVQAEEYEKFKNAGFEDIYVLEGGLNKYASDDGQLEYLEGYQKYVSPDWVEKLVNGETPKTYEKTDYKLVEITLASEKEVYENGHIKGAVKINADDLNHIPGPRNLADYESIPIEQQRAFWGLPTDESIKKILEDSGITKDTTVILYASESATTAANRAALVMDYAGVEDIRLLNGGKVLWELEKRELTTDVETIGKVDFGTSIPQNSDIIFSYEKELEMVEDENSVIASVRSWNEYLGKESGYTYIGEAGDIAKSRFAYAGSNPYAMEDFRNIDNTMFNYKIIEQRWKDWGITQNKKVSFHCGTGWRASETYYIAQALGWEEIGVYVGGWYEWTKMENSPAKESGIPSDAPEKAPKQFFRSKK